MTAIGRNLSIVIGVVIISAFVLAIVPAGSDAQTNACVNLTRLLRLGSSDATTNGEVSKLQQFLTETGDYTYGSITGFFGPATEAALKKYQCSKGIACDGTPATTGYGVVGPRTRAAMRCTGAGSGQLSMTATPSTVTAGQAVTLSWLSPTGTQFPTESCSLYDSANPAQLLAWNLSVPGSHTINPQRSATYVISCNLNGGTPNRQASVAVTVTPTGNPQQCVMLQRYLYLGHTDGTTNGEVSKLQTMLAKVGLYTVAINGVFDAVTETAVKRLQCAKNIVCTGNADTTGYGSVGPTTRTALYHSCSAGEMLGEGGIQCPQDAMQCRDGTWVGRTGPQCTFQCPAGNATSTDPIINSFDGPSSLRAFESGRWTVNASGSDILSYKINWGDGTFSGPLFSNSFLHSYSGNGTFTVEAVVSDLNSREARARKTVTVGQTASNPPGDINLTLTATPSSVDSGEQVTLSWQSTTSAFQRLLCSLYANNTQIAASFSAPGTYTHSPAVSTTYRVDCRSLVDSKAASASAYVAVEPTTSIGQCQQDAMQCSDGSYVGRTGPNCEFAQCPARNGGSGTIRLVASPASITGGQSVTLSWVPPQFTSGTASCKLYANDVQIGGTFTTQTSYTHSPTGSTTYRIECGDGFLNAYSGSTYVTVTSVGGSDPRAMTLNAVPTTATAGQMVRLSWRLDEASQSNTARCSLFANGTSIATGLGVFRSYDHYPSVSTTYRIECTVPEQSATYAGSVSVTVTQVGGGSAPTLTATPSTVAAGQAVTLNWTVSLQPGNEYSCILTANGSSIQNYITGNGSRTHNPTTNTTYQISCGSSGGQQTATASVTVTPAGGSSGPSFSVTPTSIQVGGTVTAQWSTVAGDYCTLHHAAYPTVRGAPTYYPQPMPAIGSWTVSLHESRIFNYWCSSMGTQPAKSVIVTVGGFGA